VSCLGSCIDRECREKSRLLLESMHCYAYPVHSLLDLQKALMVDVAATRELCVQLDRTKDSLSRQLASQSVSYEQVHVWQQLVVG